MRIIRLGIATAMVCGLFLGAMGSAGAVSRNCAALTSLNNKLNSIDTSSKNFKASQFEDVGDEFHDAADNAKGKLAKSLDNLGNIYDSIGGGNLSDLSKLSGKSYSKSLKTFVKASVNCS